MDRTRKFNLLGVVLILGVALFSRAKAHAAEVPRAESPSLSAAELDARLLADMTQATRHLPGRVELSIGRFDSRFKLAPCQQVETFLPPGTRLWGRTQVGMRCREGANWQVLVPIEVKVFDTVLAATNAIAPGAPVRLEDFRAVEMEVSREAPGLVVEATLPEHRVAARGITPGMLLRTEHLRARPVVADGEMVKIVYRGEGFVVSTEGKALSAATAGQNVRVQVESGRILTGVAREGGRVEVR